MTGPAVLDALRRLPHFGRAPPDLLERIAEGCRLEEFDADQPVFRQGTPSRAFFLVLEGGVRLFRLRTNGSEQVVHRIRPGQSFAEAAVIHMREYPVNATTTLPGTRLLSVGRLPLMDLFDSDPRLARAMVASLSSRLVRLVARIDDLMVPDLSTRLARYLVDLPGITSEDGVRIALPMRKKDLAAYLATTPETLSRQLGRWRDAGVASSEGRDLVVHDLDLLFALADAS